MAEHQNQTEPIRAPFLGIYTCDSERKVSVCVHLYENYINIGTRGTVVILGRGRQVAEIADLQREQNKKHLQREVETKYRKKLFSRLLIDF